MKRMESTNGAFAKLLLIVLFIITMTALCWSASAESMGVANSGTINLTEICVSVITLIFGLITTRLWPWLKARTTAAQQEGIVALARTLVYAAEQLKKTGTITDKLKYVEDGLSAAGYKIDRNAIEAAVTQLRNETGANMMETCGVMVTDAVETSSSIDGSALAESIAEGIVKGITSGGGTNEQVRGLDSATASESTAVSANDAAAGAGGRNVAADAEQVAATACRTENSQGCEAGTTKGGEQE